MRESKNNALRIHIEGIFWVNYASGNKGHIKSCKTPGFGQKSGEISI